MRIPITLVLVLAMTVAPGCCSVLHGDRTSRPQSQRGEFDFGCAIVGNFLLGGVVGIIVDLANGAAWKDKRESVSSTTNPEEVPPTATLVAVRLKNGKTLMVDRSGLLRGVDSSQAVPAVALPQSEVDRYEWLEDSPSNE